MVCTEALPAPSPLLVSFRADGVVSPLHVLPEEEARALASDCQRLLRNAEANGVAGGEQGASRSANLLAPWLHNLTRDERVLRHVRQIIGDDIFCWQADVMHKPDGSAHWCSLHQDAFIPGELRLAPCTYGKDPFEQLVSAWIALTPSTIASGAVRVIRGTHRLGLLPHALTKRPGQANQNDSNMLAAGQTVDDEALVATAQARGVPLSADEERVLELKPGELSLHHAHTLHRSGPNTSPEPRIGIAVRYVAASLRKYARPGDEDPAVLVSGVDKHHFFREIHPHGPDAAELSAEAVALHAQVRARRG